MQNNIISKLLSLLRNDTSMKKDLEIRSLIGKNILIKKRNDYLNFKRHFDKCLRITSQIFGIELKQKYNVLY